LLNPRKEREEWRRRIGDHAVSPVRSKCPNAASGAHMFNENRSPGCEDWSILHPGRIRLIAVVVKGC